MPSKNFALVARNTKDDEATIVTRGTKGDMVAELNLWMDDEDARPYAAGVARVVNAEEFGEVIVWHESLEAQADEHEQAKVDAHFEMTPFEEVVDLLSTETPEAKLDAMPEGTRPWDRRRSLMRTMTRDDLHKLVKVAFRAKAASKETPVSRQMIELCGDLNDLLEFALGELGPKAVGALAKKHLGDDRHWHVALFTDKSGASIYAHALVDALRCPAHAARPFDPKADPRDYADVECTCGKSVDAEVLKEKSGSTAPKAKQAPAQSESVTQDTRVRITPKVGKFQPIGLYRGVEDRDGVRCLILHDVEYDKERVTAVDTIERLEAKTTGRYVTITL